MEKKEYVRRMAIIANAECYDGVGNLQGKTTLLLELIETTGAKRGQVLEKRYTFEGSPPDYLCRDMLRLGYVAESLEKLKEITKQLIGIVVRVSLTQDGDALNVYIDDYYGRDNPTKYEAANR